jgi:hypothetical protein
VTNTESAKSAEIRGYGVPPICPRFRLDQAKLFFVGFEGGRGQVAALGRPLGGFAPARVELTLRLNLEQRLRSQVRLSLDVISTTRYLNFPCRAEIRSE